MPDICISREGIEKMLQNIKPDKAASLDSLPATVLKKLSHEIALSWSLYIADQSRVQLCPVTGNLPILLQSSRKVTKIKPATISQCP